MRYSQPQPYEPLSHTADAGVSVRGSSAEETLARLVLAFGSLVSGGGPLVVQEEERIQAAGEDRVETALAVLREILFRFATGRRIPAWCEVVALGERKADLRVGFGRYHPEAHAEGMDVKAVTYHAAMFEPAGEEWRAQVIFDV